MEKKSKQDRKARFSNVKIIEDNSNGELGTKITIADKCLYAGPMDIQTAEFWEHRLSVRKVPYVLVQFECTVVDVLRNSSNTLDNNAVEPRYSKGYGIFINPEILDHESNFAA